MFASDTSRTRTECIATEAVSKSRRERPWFRTSDKTRHLVAYAHCAFLREAFVDHAEEASCSRHANRRQVISEERRPAIVCGMKWPPRQELCGATSSKALGNQCGA